MKVAGDLGREGARLLEVRRAILVYHLGLNFGRWQRWLLVILILILNSPDRFNCVQICPARLPEPLVFLLLIVKVRIQGSLGAFTLLFSLLKLLIPFRLHHLDAEGGG